MNIFILAKYHTTGGMERMVCDLANELSQSTTIHLALRVKADFNELSIGLKPAIHLLKLEEPPFPDISKPKNWLKINWLYFWKLSRYIVKNQIDIIYAHDISVAQGSLLKLLSSRPLVWHNHNGEMLDFTAAKQKKYKRYLFNTDAIISVNHMLSNYCQANFPKSGRQFFSVLNYVSLIARQGTTTLPKGFNIVYVANIRAVKNQILAVEAFNQFKNLVPDANLIFVGSGEETAYGQALKQDIQQSAYSNHIYMLGAKEDIFHILKQANIGMMASQNEGSPLALLEYGFANIPIICSNIDICSYLLENGRYGYLFNKNDAQALADGLMHIKNNHQEYVQKATDFNSIIQQKYSREKVVANIYSILHSVTHDR